MKTVFPLLLCTLILFAACKKDKDSNSNPTPAPVVLPSAPDTLGAGWTKVGSIPIEETVTDVFFTDLNNGYITTSAGVYKSSDGGSNWTKFITAGDFSNIGAFGSNACFVNHTGNIYNTLNYGATTSIDDNTTVGGLSMADCFYVNSNICYATSYKYIWKSTDAGVNFDSVYNFNDNNGIEPSLFFVDDLNGWVTRNNYLYKTTDGGLHWNTNKILSNNFSPVSFIDIDNGYVGDGTNIQRTSNGGTSWEEIGTTSPNYITDIHFFTPLTGYIVAGTRIYKTTDAGINWSVAVALGDKQVVEVFFLDEHHGWACGHYGYVLRFNL